MRGDAFVGIAAVSCKLNLQALGPCDLVSLDSAHQFRAFAREHRPDYQLDVASLAGLLFPDLVEHVFVGLLRAVLI